MNHTEVGTEQQLARVGVVVHPARAIDAPLAELTRWTDEHDVEVVQIPVPGQDRRVRETGDAADCDLIVSIGGDGTMLAAIRAAAAARRPALGVACGSLGALTTVEAPELGTALERFRRGEWLRSELPGLTVRREGKDDLLAINDIAVTRGGIGQVRVTIHVDGTLFSRLAGDGCIVCTPLGSSAYSLAAGGPLLTPETEAFLLTPLPTHGGSRQSLVLAPRAELQLQVSAGVGGARLEVDGQLGDDDPGTLTVGWRAGAATLVALPDQEPLIVGLRRRRIIVDSPRIVADSHEV